MKISNESNELSLLPTTNDIPTYESNELSPQSVWLGLVKRGFTMTVVGDVLRVTPGTRLSAADREAITRHKPDMIAIVINPLSILDPAWIREHDRVPVPVHQTTPAQRWVLGHMRPKYDVEATDAPLYAIVPDNCRARRACDVLGSCDGNLGQCHSKDQHA